MFSHVCGVKSLFHAFLMRKSGSHMTNEKPPRGDVSVSESFLEESYSSLRTLSKIQGDNEFCVSVVIWSHLCPNYCRQKTTGGF